MTTEPKLLTEADVSALYELARNATPENFRKAVAMQGLIAEEPKKTITDAAVEIVSRKVDLTHSSAKPIENHWAVQCTKEGIEYGMELPPRKELTREMVRSALLAAQYYPSEGGVNRLHAALTEALQ